MRSKIDLKEVPMLRLLVPVILGILFTHFLGYKTNLLLLVFLSGCALFLLAFIWTGTSKAYIHSSFLVYLIFSLSAALAIGALPVHTLSCEKKDRVALVQSRCGLSSNRYFARLVEQTKGEDSNLSNFRKTKILLVVKDSNHVFMPGDKLFFNSKLYPIKNRGNPGEFDFEMYMAAKSVWRQAYLDSSKIYQVQKTEKFRLRKKFHSLRLLLLQKFISSGIDESELGLLVALSIGDKSLLEPEVKHAFSSAGAIHVLAVSGLHVGVLFMVLNFIFGFFGSRRLIKGFRITVVLGGIWAYAMLTGFPPSVLRACTMFSFVAFGQVLRRESSIFNTLSLSAFILLLTNPLLIFDVGFQLSYAAVFGICFFQPPLARKFSSSNKVLDYLVQLMSVTVAAQLTTFPFVLYYFNQFPIYFWLVNIFLIPLIFLDLIATIGFVVSSIFLENHIAIMPLNWFLKLTNLWVGAVESLPNSCIRNIPFSLPLAICFGFMVVGIVRFVYGKRKPGLYLFLAALIVAISYDLRQMTVNQATRLITVYSSSYPLISIRTPQGSLVQYDSSLVDKESVLHYYIGPKYLKEGRWQKNIQCNGGAFRSDMLMELDSINVVYLRDGKGLRTVDGGIDILLVGRRNLELELNERHLQSLNAVVLMQRSYDNYSDDWLDLATEYGFALHCLSKDGAYQYDF